MNKGIALTCGQTKKAGLNLVRTRLERDMNSVYKVLRAAV